MIYNKALYKTHMGEKHTLPRILSSALWQIINEQSLIINL